MKTPPAISNEAERLKALYRYDVLDSLPQAESDDLVKVASLICQTPIALISLVDSSRQWFKARLGLEASETSRNESFCAHAIGHDGAFIVPDATKDERFLDNPLVTGKTGIRFYAGAPLLTPDGHKIGTICVIDTTPRVLSETQIEALEALSRQAMQMLELRVKVRELEQAQEGLQGANDEIQRAARAKSEFLANMSHEIRTPMNGIIGMTDLALAEESQPDQRERLQIIQASSQMLLALINDILDYSKVEAGKINLEYVPFNLRESAREIYSLLKPLAERKMIGLEMKISPDVPGWIIGDSTRFKQVITNLICNALKFTAVGGATIEIDAENTAGTDEFRIHVAVSDTGIGIPAEAQSKLFQSFSQADSSTTRRYGGTGLGLAIAKALCEEMRGRIWFSSEEGRGSRFEFNLIATRTEAPPITTQAPSTAVEEKFAYGHPHEILVAEDNVINQKVISSYLAKLGYEVDIANDGAEAFRKSKEKRYTLVFMDCHMPILDGFEATAKIRASLPTSQQPRIVALTASAMKEDQERCFSVGMDDFLSKPVVLDDLKTALDSKSRAPVAVACSLGAGEILAGIRKTA